MSELFRRRVRLTVATPPRDARDYSTATVDVTTIEGLRVQFRVKKSLKKEPNTAEIVVTNLASSSRARLQGRGDRVILEAGYEGTIAQIFGGDVTGTEHRREGADWTTKILAGDGQRAMRHARVAKSFKGGTPALDVVSSVVGALGIGAGNLSAQADALRGMQFTAGYTANGRASKELDRLLLPRGLEWSIQDGRLQVLKAGAPSEESVDLGPDSGLIGTPEIGASEKKGGPPLVKARSLLQPALRPGARFRLRSERVSGDFRILTVEHIGDTHGADWFSDVEAVRL